MRRLGKLLIMAALCGAAGVFVGSRRLLKAESVTVTLAGLPAALEGLRVLHISDVHSKNESVCERFIWPGKSGGIGVTNIWEAALSLDYDIAVITGDIIDSGYKQIEPQLPFIKALAERSPVYFVEGNHDHYSMRRLRPLLEECGVIVLVDESVELEINSETIEVLGLSDYYTADLEASAELLGSAGRFRLSLFHQPQYADIEGFAGRPGIAFAGHTHGGQLRIPFMPVLYAPGQGFFPEYGYGAYEIGEAAMFVSKGIGATGRTFRLWNRPEMNIIQLER